ncbi:MAG: DUF401 family protein [FCB group bacterium]|nr:DUF401 family protein [FCB group bacterium]
MEAVKLIAVFVFIVIALRLKISVGVTLFLAGVITALMYNLKFLVLLEGYWELIKSWRFISLTLVIILITILGALLKELKFLDKLTKACNNLYGGNRTAVSILPGLVGLMPMPGGALLSAPLVDNVLSDKKYSPEFKTVANYWFRHIVEFFWPVYPGLILSAAITGVPLYKISMLQFPLTVVMVILGIIFFSRKIDLTNGEAGGTLLALKGIANTIWPIILAIVIYGLFKIPLAFAVLLSIILLVIIAKPKKESMVISLKHGLTFKLIFLVFGILSFQTVLQLTGAIDSITKLTVDYKLPAELVIFLVCFTSGLLTGMVAAFVGLSYSLLAGYLYQPQINISHIFLAYLSGYIGMIFSPTHLCLILTNEYFKSDLVKVYKKMLIPVILLALIGFLIYLSNWGRLF